MCLTCILTHTQPKGPCQVHIICAAVGSKVVMMQWHNHLLDLCCAVYKAVVAELLSHIQTAEYSCVAGLPGSYKPCLQLG